MGRTFHYTITKKSGAFTKRELLEIDAFNTEMNSRTFKDAWSCENLYILGPLSYFPNWPTMDIILKGKNKPHQVWHFLDKEYTRLKKEGHDHYNIIVRLVRNGYVYIGDKDLQDDILNLNAMDTNWYPSITSFRGFTKTAGDEMNSALVYLALVYLSKKVPSVVIDLYDEGDLLKHKGLKIHQGQTMLDITELKELIQDMVMKAYTQIPFIKAQLNLDSIGEGVIDLLGINDYGRDHDHIQMINEKIAELVEFTKLVSNDSGYSLQSSSFLETPKPVLQNPFNFINLDVLVEHLKECSEHTSRNKNAKVLNAIVKKLGIKMHPVVKNALEVDAVEELQPV